jgi:hypothetical protein
MLFFICFAEDTRTLLPPNILRERARIAQQCALALACAHWHELRICFATERVRLATSAADEDRVVTRRDEPKNGLSDPVGA